MPITVGIVNHPATAWTKQEVSTSERLLEAACPRQYRRSERVVQSSFTSAKFQESHVSASENGFVWAAYHAYNDHHHLQIRPEDVWFAILTQMSFFINGHAEELRAYFVDHQGQKKLEVVSNIDDFGYLAVQMTNLISKNVLDRELRDWVMPSFTTTTAEDKVVGAILFMGAMQKYFSFKMTVLCGLPSVTLLGEVDDWKEILGRLDKIDTLGEEPKQFANMLRPVLRHMVMSFEDPTNTEVTNFWNAIVHRNWVGSGTDYLSGWLTAFCYWNEEGITREPRAENTLFRDVQYPTVAIDSIPAGFASVPVSVNDNGNKYPATMIAGSVGIAALNTNTSSNGRPEMADTSDTSSPNEQTSPVSGTRLDGSVNDPIRDTVQPISGWWICENEAPEKAAAREAEKKQLQHDIDQGWEDEEKLGSDSQRRENLFSKSDRLQELEAY